MLPSLPIPEKLLDENEFNAGWHLASKNRPEMSFHYSTP
jgi:hypothetical protein